MASAASTFGWWIGVGGALFLSSDMLIAIGIAAPHLFGQGVAVMITYTVGQALIETGWISTVTDGISVPRSRIGTSADSLSSRSTALR
jgi:hypothetical protein